MSITSKPEEVPHWECFSEQQNHSSNYIESGEWWLSFADEVNIYQMNYFPYFNERQISIGDIDGYKKYQYFTFPELKFEESYIYFKKFISLKAFL
jgi:hypothetical protein